MRNWWTSPCPRAASCRSVPTFRAACAPATTSTAHSTGQTNAYVSAGISYSGSSKSGIAGSAFFVEDTLERSHGGRGSGLKIAHEGGLFAGGNCGTYDAPSFCPNGRYVQDSYVFLDLAFGVERDNWSAEVFVDNVTDKRAQLNVDTLQYVPKVVTNRPRSIGLRVSYDFDG